MSKYSFAFAILTAFLWGLAPLFEKLGLVKISPLTGATLRSLGVAAFLVTVLFASGNVKELLEVNLKTGILIVIGGLLGGGIGGWTFYKALKYGDVSRVVPIVRFLSSICLSSCLASIGGEANSGERIGGSSGRLRDFSSSAIRWGRN